MHKNRFGIYKRKPSFLVCLVLVAFSLIEVQSQTSNFDLEISQLTFGEKHHFFGYIGQCRTIPWNESGRYILGANDRVILGSIGLRGRGKGLLDNFSKMYDKGVRIKTICDVDSQFFDERVALAAENQNGNKPGAETDMRSVFDDQEIDAVVIAVTNHWHALSTIWACQAGKHVYIEKPSSHNVWEGRKKG